MLVRGDSRGRIGAGRGQPTTVMVPARRGVAAGRVNSTANAVTNGLKSFVLMASVGWLFGLDCLGLWLLLELQGLRAAFKLTLSGRQEVRRFSNCQILAPCADLTFPTPCFSSLRV